jgi:hypothetical protein
MKKSVPCRPWQHYPNENFDRTTVLALSIADDERANGRVEPRYGYSRGDWLRAEEMINNSVD